MKEILCNTFYIFMYSAIKNAMDFVTFFNHPLNITQIQHQYLVFSITTCTSKQFE